MQYITTCTQKDKIIGLVVPQTFPICPSPITL